MLFRKTSWNRATASWSGFLSLLQDLLFEIIHQFRDFDLVRTPGITGFAGRTDPDRPWTAGPLPSIPVEASGLIGGADNPWQRSPGIHWSTCRTGSRRTNPPSSQTRPAGQRLCLTSNIGSSLLFMFYSFLIPPPKPWPDP